MIKYQDRKRSASKKEAWFNLVFFSFRWGLNPQPNANYVPAYTETKTLRCYFKRLLNVMLRYLFSCESNELVKDIFLSRFSLRILSKI